MSRQDITYANDFAEVIGPILKMIRATGFFEAYVFIPAMTLASLVMFFWLARNGYPRSPVAWRWFPKRVWIVACYGLCFLATNVTAVAFKTLILEELDYENSVWFASWVGTLHFYILSVVVAYLALIFRSNEQRLVVTLGVYVQVGLLGGYTVAIYRLLNEPISLTDPTGGLSGFINLAWFGFYNVDVATRLVRSLKGDTTFAKLVVNG